MAEFSDKFVAFVDILGFKNLVHRAAGGDGVTLDDLLHLTGTLGPVEARDIFRDYGPICCPEAPLIQKCLDFQITQISDCVIVSSEVSPAGLINLVQYCWGSVFRLLGMGRLCRGYITLGKVYHTECQVVGPAYQEAFSREEKVSAFADGTDGKETTPFVEIAPSVLEYVGSQSDQCVSEMFERMVRRIPGGAALFPFKQLNAGGALPDDWPKANAAIREGINKYKHLIRSLGRPSSKGAESKIGHYEKVLDEQLRLCDELDRLVEMSQQPAVALVHPPRLRR